MECSSESESWAAKPSMADWYEYKRREEGGSLMIFWRKERWKWSLDLKREGDNDMACGWSWMM